ncbi:MAG: antitoxin [Actinomycetota bacterium]|nr:antitoxin [Actinomycetota bacterium]
MKLSVSMSQEDVDLLDGYAARREVGSRSAAIQRAVALLRAAELGDAYEAAWNEWAESEEEPWEVTVGDGLDDAADSRSGR